MGLAVGWAVEMQTDCFITVTAVFYTTKSYVICRKMKSMALKFCSPMLSEKVYQWDIR